MKILIVGSGPSSYGALLKLANFSNIEITMIDNSTKMDESFDECIFQQNFDEGNRIPNNLNIYDKKIDEELKNGPYASKIFGGFSNVWGGTVFPPSESEKKIYSDLGIDIERFIGIINENIQTFGNELDSSNLVKTEFTKRESFLYKKLKLNSSSNFDSYPAKICINSNNPYLSEAELLCKNCKNYLWSCRNDTIWSTKSYIKKMIQNGQIKYIPNGYLMEVKESDSVVKCNIVIDDHIQNLEFDKVFLGCGPINTSKIIMESFDIDNLEIKTCDMVSLPYFTFKFGSPKNHSFADIFTYFKKEKVEFFLQIYGFSKSLVTLASNVLPITKILKYLPSSLFSNFGGIFLYVNQNYSTTLNIHKDENSKFNIYKKEITNPFPLNTFKKLKTLLKKSGIFIIPFISKKFFYGKSNHYGSQFAHKNIKDEFSSDRLGRIFDLENVHILDSSVLPVLNVGPLTVTIIANSYRIIEEIFDK